MPRRREASDGATMMYRRSIHTASSLGPYRLGRKPSAFRQILFPDIHKPDGATILIDGQRRPRGQASIRPSSRGIWQRTLMLMWPPDCAWKSRA
jgi:hypothetical protein